MREGKLKSIVFFELMQFTEVNTESGSKKYCNIHSTFHCDQDLNPIHQTLQIQIQQKIKFVPHYLHTKMY